MSNNDDQLGMIPGQACAARRFADALLRSGGDTQITVRISDPSTGDTSSQLGLEPPSAEDLQISPALVKALAPTEDGRRRIEAVISATSLKAIAKNYGVEDIAAWLLVAQGVLYYGNLMRIDIVTVDRFFGLDCLYHLTATE
jgi:hypothetical protein